METKYSPSRFFRLFSESILEYRAGISFVKKYQVWKGLNEYRWVVRLFIFLAIGLSLYGLLNGSISEVYHTFFLDSGSMYITLIFLEVLIFHCSVRTLNILRGQNIKPKFKDFVLAERRMILVSLRCFVIEAVIIFLLKDVLFEIISFGVISTAIIYAVRFYFTGFVFIDNYNEQYGQSIRESMMTIREHSGVAVGIGLVAYFMLKIPIAGAVLAPILGSVVATLFMENLGVHEDEQRLLPHEFVDSITFPDAVPTHDDTSLRSLS